MFNSYGRNARKGDAVSHFLWVPWKHLRYFDQKNLDIVESRVVGDVLSQNIEFNEHLFKTQEENAFFKALSIDDSTQTAYLGLEKVNDGLTVPILKYSLTNNKLIDVFDYQLDPVEGVGLTEIEVFDSLLLTLERGWNFLQKRNTARIYAVSLTDPGSSKIPVFDLSCLTRSKSQLDRIDNYEGMVVAPGYKYYKNTLVLISDTIPTLMEDKSHKSFFLEF